MRSKTSSLPKQSSARRRGTVSTQEILNQPVMDMNGESFGRISEIVFEIERGMVAYVVIDCQGDRRCALLFEMLHIDCDPTRLHASVHRDMFVRERHIDNASDYEAGRSG